MEAVSKLALTAIKAHAINPVIHFEVFIHKVLKIFNHVFITKRM